MGPKKLEFHYGVPYTRGKEVLEALNASFPKVVDLWAQLGTRAAASGYLENPFGRRRYFHDVASEIPKVCNFLAQSTAADILFYCQRRLVQGLKGHGFHVATVHDSNLVEGRDRDTLVKVVRSAMTTPVPCMQGFSVPCEVKVGKNWYQMEKVQ